MVRPCKITLLSCMVGALLSIGAVDLGSGEECYMHIAQCTSFCTWCTLHNARMYLPSDEAHFARHRACLYPRPMSWYVNSTFIYICQLKVSPNLIVFEPCSSHSWIKQEPKNLVTDFFSVKILKKDKHSEDWLEYDFNIACAIFWEQSCSSWPSQLGCESHIIPEAWNRKGTESGLVAERMRALHTAQSAGVMIKAWPLQVL